MCQWYGKRTRARTHIRTHALSYSPARTNMHANTSQSTPTYIHLHPFMNAGAEGPGSSPGAGAGAGAGPGVGAGALPSPSPREPGDPVIFRGLLDEKSLAQIAATAFDPETKQIECTSIPYPLESQKRRLLKGGRGRGERASTTTALQRICA